MDYQTESNRTTHEGRDRDDTSPGAAHHSAGGGGRRGGRHNNRGGSFPYRGGRGSSRGGSYNRGTNERNYQERRPPRGRGFHAPSLGADSSMRNNFGTYHDEATRIAERGASVDTGGYDYEDTGDGHGHAAELTVQQQNMDTRPFRNNSDRSGEQKRQRGFDNRWRPPRRNHGQSSVDENFDRQSSRNYRDSYGPTNDNLRPEQSRGTDSLNREFTGDGFANRSDFSRGGRWQHYNSRGRGGRDKAPKNRHRHETSQNFNKDETCLEDTERRGDGAFESKRNFPVEAKPNADKRITGKPKNQREVLMDQLSRNVYECMVCVEKVRYSQPVWSCKRCFNVFHLTCIRKWASSSADECGWRCPGCQSYCDTTPDHYYCLCGKTKNPKFSKYDIPHTCGQVCGKLNPGGLNCEHSCNSQCHPGPCPSCEVQQTRYCGCGKTNAQVKCGSKVVLICENVCGKVLECGIHKCSRICHFQECDTCDEKLNHECHCKSEKKQVACTRNANLCTSYSCLKNCKKTLSCGNHSCENICHSGSCSPCKTSIEAVLSCPCGQTPIREACAAARLPPRKTCLDRIPTCSKTCLKVLPCGDMDNKHRCQFKCHQDKECPLCPLISNVKCRCGIKTMEIPCKELKNQDEVLCQKKCSKKRSCGKHKCNLKCCIDVDHICSLVCQRQLRCGKHTCTNLCHLNPCLPCGIVSFEELPCECGASIIYPPVPCGTRRPPCHLPCSRQHTCDHPVHHPCHSEPNCPPCTVLTEKWCHGKHELRKNVMCYINELSCGLPCGKILLCNRHACSKNCHGGVCLAEGAVCKLPCCKLRDCGHQCGAPCHEDACPATKCKIMTDVNCPCGRRIDTMICWKREIEYDRTVTWEYHKELKRLETESTDQNTRGEDWKQKIMEEVKEKTPKSAVLECDKECAKFERNRKLADALQIDNADVTTSVGTPNYSEFLTKFAKKNPQFIETIHKQLTALVLKAKQSRKKNETYGFNSMNRDKRHVIHEYSDHFGILSESFDEEPNRNVVCFASKEKSYLPSVSLVDAVFRPAIRSERLKPNDDVVFRPEKRTQIVGPSNWSMKAAQRNPQSDMVALNPSQLGAFSGPTDFPPL